MKCPHCEKPLLPKDYENISVSTCKDCSGIWMEPSQLSHLVSLREEKFSPSEIQDTLQSAYPGLTDEDLASALPCPECSSEMQEINYNYCSGVILNSCQKGHGLWFDKDELEKAQIFMEHWDDKSRIHKAELLEKLKQTRADYNAQESAEINEDRADTHRLSKTKILSRVFTLFDLMKLDK